MKKTLYPLLAAVVIGSSVTSYAQITLKQDYENRSADTIGTFQGILFKEGGFSTLFPIPGTGGKEFWTCSDRGVNVDCASANPDGCHPTYDKMFCFPDYAPKLHHIKLDGDSVQILHTITMKRPDGTNARGVLNPTGFGSKSAELASTDTVNDCSDFDTKVAAKDEWALDPEGLVKDAEGNFWVSEENGPTIWKMDATGKVLQRFTPYAGQDGAAAIDEQIDTVFKYRKNNRGFESMAMTPNGKLYTIIQSPLLYPDKATGENSEVHRMLELDPATGNMRMLVYLNDGIIGAAGPDQIRLSDWKIGDLAAINDTTFLVIEAATRGATIKKNIYLINISQATPIVSGLYGTKTAEGLVDSAGLAEQGIKAVKKTLFMDLTANGWPAALDKSEGLAIINDSTIAVSNDNDFGQVSPDANGIATATGILCHVFTYGLQGDNKIPGLVTGGPSSVEELKPVAQATLYPNPATQHATLAFSLQRTADVNVSVYDLQGRMVLPVAAKTAIAGPQAIDMNIQSLENGFYFVQLNAAGQRMQFKLVVAH